MITWRHALPYIWSIAWRGLLTWLVLMMPLGMLLNGLDYETLELPMPQWEREYYRDFLDILGGLLFILALVLATPAALRKHFMPLIQTETNDAKVAPCRSMRPLSILVMAIVVVSLAAPKDPFGLTPSVYRWQLLDRQGDRGDIFIDRDALALDGPHRTASFLWNRADVDASGMASMLVVQQFDCEKRESRRLSAQYFSWSYARGWTIQVTQDDGSLLDGSYDATSWEPVVAGTFNDTLSTAACAR